MQPKKLCESRHIDTATCRSIENLRPAAVTASGLPAACQQRPRRNITLNDLFASEARGPATVSCSGLFFRNANQSQGKPTERSWVLPDAAISVKWLRVLRICILFTPSLLKSRFAGSERCCVLYSQCDE
jgi:hypothetical protein